MRFTFLLLALLCFPLTACVEQTLQRTVDNFTPNMSAFNPTTKEMHGIVLSVQSCSLSNRVIECRMSATSKFQDRTLILHGSNYLKVQDDTGVSYPAFVAFGPNAKDRSQRSAKLVADTPYTISLRAENISTQATTVRAIDVIRFDVRGPSGNSYIKVTYPHPPMRNAQNHMPSAPPAHTGAVATQSVPPLHSQQNNVAQNAYEFLFATITPINEHVPADPGIKALWGKGAYLHLNPNGSLGHNWSKPGPYVYVPGQTWRRQGNSLVIVFEPNFTYSFDLTQGTAPMTTYLDQGGIYKMIAHIKHKGQP